VLDGQIFCVVFVVDKISRASVRILCLLGDIGRGLLVAGGDPAVEVSLAGVAGTLLFDFEQSGELGGRDDAGPLV
jgi:hypothetical protein